MQQTFAFSLDECYLYDFFFKILACLPLLLYYP